MPVSVLFIVSAYVGHFNSVAGLAAALRRKGVEIYIAGSPVHENAARRNGFSFLSTPYLDIISTPFGIDRKFTGMNFRGVLKERMKNKEIMARFPEVVSDIQRLCRDVRPDILFFDPFMLFYYPAFYPYCKTIFALSPYPLLDPDRMVPPYTSGLIEENENVLFNKTILVWCRQFIRYTLWSLKERWVYGASLYTMMRRLSQLCNFPVKGEWAPRYVYFDVHFKSVPELVLFGKEFEFKRKAPLRTNVYYIGPCVDAAREEAPIDLHTIDIQDKLILCTLSTISFNDDINIKTRFFDQLIQAMRDRPEYTLIAALGEGLRPADFKDIPGNVYLFITVPQLKILSKADLFINHGGSNSIKEAIHFGVPVIVYPNMADQPGVAARVESHMIGKRGDFYKDNASHIGESIDEVLGNPVYLKNMYLMKARFAAYTQKPAALYKYLKEIGSY
ncbi:MAG TPA: nucleotide disphospho-sugar-binding domain-containing protein [Chitinophaga sp.]|uniref:nucleotide disphospho-sugar-binding domain-containing protein n=1 Tax=Chitinophaga sp. TaxID=1869181 RepID=UPI002B934437|nr:nucleotide disphospho-sugar-binding domain-containing protein [Chitinophaga sp.]HVI46151.1 nucleotide disphospho-sugar-binding domain-containing protein [Chitinophaga sp.]